MEEPKRKILFIVGAGRSGSTVLDIVLGSHPEIFGAGELVHLPERGWLRNERCACGERVNECAFWRDVRSRFCGASSPDAVERLVALQRRFESARSLLFHSRRSADPGFREYLHLLDLLLRCALDASGRRHLVDSSKKPLRALALSRLAGFDVCLLHLVRDSRGVAWSKAKSLALDERHGVQADQPAAPVARTARRWLVTNLLCSLLFPGRRTLRVRYEDLVADPAATLRRIASHFEIDLDETIRSVVAGEELRATHTVAGNRLRMHGGLRLRPDLEWREKLGAAQESSVWRWTGWLLRRYGYRRGLEAPPQPLAVPPPVGATHSAR